ncbi:hypothetical protein OS126_09105 [Corynebacterium sp. P5834]|nr:hypothetical protein [Corynebacterium antarcticum]MCX7540870.1 hypothetical protein [Corynebacterium antarcticum]
MNQASVSSREASTAMRATMDSPLITSEITLMGLRPRVSIS